MPRAFFTCVLIGLALPALAIGKVTTDPNASGAAAPTPDILQGVDVRLSKAVSISQAQTQVWKILDELSKSSGVILKAGSGSYDWQVRDRKMSIFAKDVPLAQIMNSISHVMKFKWERKGDPGRGDAASPHASVPGRYVYRLYMDRRTLLDAEAQRARAETKEAEEQTRKRQNALDTFCKLSSMTPDQKAKLRDENPFLYAVSSGWGESMGAFLREVPAVSDALASGQKISVEGASLTPAGRAGLVSAMRAELEMEDRFGGGGRHALPDNFDAAKTTIVVNESMENVPAPIKGLFLGELRFRSGRESISTPFINPNNEVAKWLGKLMIQAKESGAKLDDVMKEHQSEVGALLTKEAEVEAGGEAEVEHPEDPALLAKVKLAPETPALYNVEMDLANASKLAVVSDYFPNRDWGGVPRQGPPHGEMELKAALEQIGDCFIYNWDKRDGVIELRDRNWFRKRAAQIPDAWLEKWRDELKTTGTIDIDSLAQIAQLTLEQINSNLALDEDLGPTTLTASVTSGRELLRFYASLTSDQRAALSSQRGLDVFLLSQEQSDQFYKLLETRAVNVASGQRMLMTCQRSQGSEKIPFYTFRLSVDGKIVQEWRPGIVRSYKPIPSDAKKTPEPAKPSKQ